MKETIALELEAFAEDLLQKAQTAHDREKISRAHTYTLRRIEDEVVTDVFQAKLLFAAFADGWCTGTHRGEPHCHGMRTA